MPATHHDLTEADAAPDLPAAAADDEPHDLTAVRAWARSRGYPVDESARLPLQVLRTYRRVHGL